jgi:hypothetical protein
LRDECQSWWPAGFAQLRQDEFRALVEEMAELGVLASVAGGWRLKSPNVLRMLGTAEQIEEALFEAESQQPPARFAAAEMRRVLDPAAGVRSPLSESQLAELLSIGQNRISVVLGSSACGVEQVRTALEAAAGPSRANVYPARKRAEYQSLLAGGDAGEHRVVISALRATDDACETSLTAALSTPVAAKTTRSVVMVVPTENLNWWPEVLARSGDEVAVVELRRHTSLSLWVWAVDVPTAFQDQRSRDMLLEATGGWPVLVDRAGRLAAGGATQQEALDRIRDELSTTEGAETLVDEVGLRGSGLEELFGRILDLVDEPVEYVDLAALAADLFEDADSVVDALRSLGVLNVNDSGRYVPEPIIASASVLTKSHDEDMHGPRSSDRGTAN